MTQCLWPWCAEFKNAEEMIESALKHIPTVIQKDLLVFVNILYEPSVRFRKGLAN